jgi:hypothetical protein
MLTFNTLDDFANLGKINLMGWNERFLRKAWNHFIDSLKVEP